MKGYQIQNSGDNKLELKALPVQGASDHNSTSLFRSALQVDSDLLTLTSAARTAFAFVADCVTGVMA